VLEATWRRAIKLLGPVERNKFRSTDHGQRLVIGGKSMGGRIASLIADDAGVDALICLGYPFHPVGRPERLRVEHLEEIKTSTLIVQGERDPFGSRDEVAAYKLSSAIQLCWIVDGDHSLKPRKSSGRTERQNWDMALGSVETFLAPLRKASHGQ
jgi:uncharacterized protein